MEMPAPRAIWTVDMLDALPDDGQRYELIDGELFVSPAPGEEQQLIVGELYALLREYLLRERIGRAMVSPADVRRDDHSRNRVQPDVFVTRLTDGRRPAYPYDLTNLLLAVEVPSPSNAIYDYQRKRELYLSSGVPEYWIFDGAARNVARWTHEGDPGEVLSERLLWHPVGANHPFVLDLPEFFTDALA